MLLAINVGAYARSNPSNLCNQLNCVAVMHRFSRSHHRPCGNLAVFFRLRLSQIHDYKYRTSRQGISRILRLYNEPSSQPGLQEIRCLAHSVMLQQLLLLGVVPLASASVLRATPAEASTFAGATSTFAYFPDITGAPVTPDPDFPNKSVVGFPGPTPSTYSFLIVCEHGINI